MKLPITLLAGALIAMPAAWAGDTPYAEDREMDNDFQAQPAEPITDTHSRRDRTLAAMPESDIVGKDVVNPAGAEYGHVEQVVTSPATSQKLAVIEIDELLEIDKQVLVPLSDLSLTDEGDLLTSLSEDGLKNQPEFDAEFFEDEIEEAE